MKATSLEIRIGNQTLDGRETLEKLQEGTRAEEVERVAAILIAVERQDLALVETGIARVENDVGGEPLGREMVGETPHQLVGQQVLEHDVRKGSAKQ